MIFGVNVIFNLFIVLLQSFAREWSNREKDFVFIHSPYES